jgi:hypothetical protein
MSEMSETDQKHRRTSGTVGENPVHDAGTFPLFQFSGATVLLLPFGQPKPGFRSASHVS